MIRRNPDPQKPALGVHLPTKRECPLPDAPGIPAHVRVVDAGVVVDDWFIALPLSHEQLTWLLDMAARWILLDDSPKNRSWVLGILDAIEFTINRTGRDGPHSPPRTS